LSDLGKDIFFEIDASGISDSALIRLNSDFFINTSGKELEPLFIFHPQEVRIILDDYASKKVPVDLQSSYSMAAGYVTSGPFVLEPDSIEISGPKSRVEKIQSVKTAKMHDRDLTEDFSREIDLLTNGFPTVKYSENKVEAYQKIVRKGSVTFKVPVNLINIPEGKSILIEPIAVDITVEGPVNELQKMTAGDFYAEADVSQMDNITNRMPLQVTTSIGLKWGQNTTEIRAVLY
jgi:YbbR domain-containing protein